MIGGFGIAYLARLVDFFAGEADVSGGWNIVLLRNISDRPNLPPVLRRVVDCLSGHTKVSKTSFFRTGKSIVRSGGQVFLFGTAVLPTLGNLSPILRRMARSRMLPHAAYLLHPAAAKPCKTTQNPSTN